jgi:hypothetical protein
LLHYRWSVCDLRSGLPDCHMSIYSVCSQGYVKVVDPSGILLLAHEVKEDTR